MSWSIFRPLMPRSYCCCFFSVIQHLSWNLNHLKKMLRRTQLNLLWDLSWGKKTCDGCTCIFWWQGVTGNGQLIRIQDRVERPRCSLKGAVHRPSRFQEGKCRLHQVTRFLCPFLAVAKQKISSQVVTNMYNSCQLKTLFCVVLKTKSFKRPVEKRVAVFSSLCYP